MSVASVSLSLGARVLPGRVSPRVCVCERESVCARVNVGGVRASCDASINWYVDVEWLWERGLTLPPEPLRFPTGPGQAESPHSGGCC